MHESEKSKWSHSVVSDSLWPHESQHARPPCPSPTPRVHSNSCPSSQWCNPAISSSVVPFSFCPQSLPAWVFSNESTLRMRWPKYWSFSFSIIPSKEIPGLISTLYLIHQRRQWQPTPVLLPGKSHEQRSLVGFSPWGRSQTRLSDFTFTFHFHASGKETATHSSVLAWRIPGIGEPGGLPSIGSHRVGHDWSHLTAAYLIHRA